jgi:hypothetical protein
MVERLGVMYGWIDRPLVVLTTTLVALGCAAFIGERLRKFPRLADAATDFAATLPAALTLLGLILGFSFSMAVSRYDLRKTYEEAEANSIGTQYVRASLLPADDAARLRDLLAQYTKLRIEFYHEHDDDRVNKVNTETATLQNRMWQLVVDATASRRDPLSGLIVAGMNDVLNAQGYTPGGMVESHPARRVAAAVDCGIGVQSADRLFGEAHRAPQRRCFADDRCRRIIFDCRHR